MACCHGCFLCSLSVIYWGFARLPLFNPLPPDQFVAYAKPKQQLGLGFCM